MYYRNQGGPNNWGQVKKLTASNGAAGDQFGFDVTIDGDNIAVGAHVKSGYTGYVYIFNRNHGGVNNWGQVKILSASDAAVFKGFGLKVSLSGSTLIVGANDHFDYVSNPSYHSPIGPGGAYIFYQNAGGTNNWGQIKKITASDAVIGDMFGYVDIHGDYAVVGAIGKNNNIGAAYLFYRNHGGTDNWGQVKKLVPPSGTTLTPSYGLGISRNSNVYFTRNNYINGKTGMDAEKVIHLKLYRAKLENNKFKNIVELAINDDNYSTTHPSLSADGKTLYFSSNRPGGQGGMDIYSVQLDENGLAMGTPTNLGSKINTPEHELFPHYNSSENLLFFSSEGHFGLGGLDVFAAKLNNDGKVKAIENLRFPINSTSDDFAYISNENQTSGYFSSNREGGKGSDDIYGFKQLTPISNFSVLKGKVENLITEQLVGGAMIYISDTEGNKRDSIQSDKNGNYEIELIGIEEDFIVTAKAEGYLDYNKRVKYENEKDEFIEDLGLMPELKYYLTGVITDKTSREKLEGVKVTIYDNNKNSEEFDITQSGEGGVFKSKTIPHEYKDRFNYKLKLEKKGYVTKEVLISDILSTEEELNANRYRTLDMTKIEIGKTDLNEVVDIKDINFDFNKSNIRPDAAIELDKVVEVMQNNPSIVIQLRAYTDQRGNKSYNLKLSDRRAKASAQYIISKGIPKDRVTGKGYGATNPLYTEAEIAKVKTEEAREELYEKNRRTEFIIVKIK